MFIFNNYRLHNMMNKNCNYDVENDGDDVGIYVCRRY